VAGGGTGDGAIMVAQQLADAGGGWRRGDLHRPLTGRAPLPRRGPRREGSPTSNLGPWPSRTWPATILAPSTTSIVAVCCTTWPTRRKA
jgi:hypothetical protein